jgi:putative ABC transport system permease protein
MIGTIGQDLRHGVRMLAKNPGFSLIAILSIAIGVGANAAMFSLADGLVLRPLSVPRASEVVSVVETNPQPGQFFAPRLSYPDYVDIRDGAKSFDALVAYRDVVTGFDARPDQPALRTIGAVVSANFFDAMGVRPASGRFFRAEEDLVPGRDPVVVLDHRAWTERFGSDPAILGRRVRITNTDFTVVGVSEPSFKGLAQDVWPTFYVPLAMLREAQNPPTDDLTRRDRRGIQVKGRLNPGVTLSQARQEVARIATDLAERHPETNKGHGLTVRTEFEIRTSGPDAALVTLLFILSAAVLLVACANVAGLLTSRAPERAREIALRLAIGAGRPRLIRQLVTESLLIAVGGGALGLAIGYGGILMFRQIEFPTEVPLKLTFELDRRVMIVGLLVATASALLSSLIPAWQTTRADLVTTIKNAAAATRRPRQWGRHSLVCLQIALSMVVLTVAAAIYRDFTRWIDDGPGYRTEAMLMMRFDPRLTQYDAARSREFYRLLKEGAAGLPGVTSIALTSAVPLKVDTSEGFPIAPEGVELPNDARDVNVSSSRIDEGFFETMRIPVLEGRAFTAADDDTAPRVAMVNQTLAAHYWPNESPIGKRLRLTQANGDRPWLAIVGVAATTKRDWLGETPQEFLYLPRLQNPPEQSTLLVATSGDATALAGPLLAVVRSIDPNMPVFSVRTMASLYEARGVAILNLIVRIVGSMGSMGLMLALVGLYGLVAYAVSRRTREIGIRMAVGAAPGSVLRMVLRRGLELTLAGLVIGAAASWATGTLLRGLFPGEGITLDAYVRIVPVVCAVTLLAAYLPARRAARIDPLRALRVE